MNNQIRIPPFGNWGVADSAMKAVTENTSSKEPAKNEYKSKELISVLQYETNERRMVFMLPIEFGENIYTAAFPDPVLLYLSISQKQFQISEQIKSELFEIKSMKSGGNIRMFNSTVNNTNDVYNTYLQSRVCSIIMLHSSIEAFVNSVIPENIQYSWTTKKGTRVLNKREIDKKIIFKDKLIKVLAFVTGIDLENNHKDLTDGILDFYKVRNDFVHLKSYMENGFKPSHTTVFNDMLNMDIEKYQEVAYKFMNLIKPNYIVKIGNRTKKLHVTMSNKSIFKRIKIGMKFFFHLFKTQKENPNLIK